MITFEAKVDSRLWKGPVRVYLDEKKRLVTSAHLIGRGCP